MVHFFVIILNSHVWDEENTTDGHIRRHSFNNRSMAGRWGGGSIDDGGWCEIYINRKFCLFLSAAYSQNSK